MFRVFYFVPLICMPVCVPIPCWFYYYSSIIGLEMWNVNHLQHHCFHWGLLWLFRFFVVAYYCGFFSYFVKNVVRILIGITLNIEIGLVEWSFSQYSFYQFLSLRGLFIFWYIPNAFLWWFKRIPWVDVSPPSLGLFIDFARGSCEWECVHDLFLSMFATGT